MLEYACGPCHRGSARLETLLQHLSEERHQAKVRSSYTCHSCGMRCRTSKELEHHLSKNVTHMRTQLYICYLNGIDEGLTTKEAQDYAYGTVNRGKEKGIMPVQSDTMERSDRGRANPVLEGKCLCRSCRLLFLSASDLTMHLTWPASHTQDGTQFTCQSCDRRFESRNDLLGHLRQQPLHMRIGKQAGVHSAYGSSQASDAAAGPSRPRTERWREGELNMLISLFFDADIFSNSQFWPSIQRYGSSRISNAESRQHDVGSSTTNPPSDTTSHDPITHQVTNGCAIPNMAVADINRA